MEPYNQRSIKDNVPKIFCLFTPLNSKYNDPFPNKNNFLSENTQLISQNKKPMLAIKKLFRNFAEWNFITTFAAEIL
ncbi:MAG: hypothetical protein IJ759_05765 [Bacteroidales bacterium]|nr:hypothetical protein [Bacteroidales bacterium]